MARKSQVQGNHHDEGTPVSRNGGLVRIGVTLTGASPLLMNAMSEEQLLAIWGREKPAKSAARPLPRDYAATKVHTLPDGRPYVPASALYSCFINAGQYIRLDGKRQISTEKKTMLPGMLQVEENDLPLCVPGTFEQAGWEVSIMKGTNPNGGEAVCIIRPRFDAWEVRCTLQVDQAQMPVDMAHDLIVIAGSRIGLLDYRPQRKGTYGTFRATRWEVLRAVEAA